MVVYLKNRKNTSFIFLTVVHSEIGDSAKASMVLLFVKFESLDNLPLLPVYETVFGRLRKF
jgi:hypothetical protein